MSCTQAELYRLMDLIYYKVFEEEPPRIETVLRYLRQAEALGLVAAARDCRIYINASMIAAFLSGRRQRRLA